MTSRDLSTEYLGVAVDDRDPQAIFDGMLARAQELLPAWEPRNGALETVVMEATSTGIADLIYAANRVLGALTEGVLSIYGVARYEGEPATGTVRLTLAASDTVTIPEGSLFRVDAVDSLLVSTEEVLQTGTTVDVPVASLDTGGWLNDVPAGTVCDPVVPVPGAIAGELLTALSGGADAESDLEYLQRSAARFARVTSSLVRASDFVAFALESPAVGRAVAVDEFDDGAGSGDPGDHPGYISVYLYGKGSALAVDDLEALADAMSAQAASILSVVTVDAEPVSFNVTANVTAAEGYPTDELETAITNALNDAWSWQYSGFGSDVDPLDVLAVIENVPGVDEVTALSAPSTDVTIGFQEFPVLGTVSLTIV